MRAARQAGVLAVYGENLRYAPQVTRAKEVFNAGGIGEPLLMRVTELHSGPSHADWFWDAALSGGGVALDMGIHGIYVISWLLEGLVTNVVAVGSTLKWQDRCLNGAEDTALSILALENGRIAELANTWVISGGIDTRLEVFGTNGNI